MVTVFEWLPFPCQDSSDIKREVEIVFDLLVRKKKKQLILSIYLDSEYGNCITYILDEISPISEFHHEDRMSSIIIVSCYQKRRVGIV